MMSSRCKKDGMNNVIVIGTSTGGLEALSVILRGLPADLSAAVLIVMHVGEYPSVLPQLLTPHSALPVRHAQDRQPLEAGVVLVAPPGWHLLVVREDQQLLAVLSHSAKENHSRPAVDPLFRTAAAAAGTQVIGVVLTGHLDDGAAGLQAVKACGGFVIVQDPVGALIPDMPRNALDQVDVDLCLPLSEIAAALTHHVALAVPNGSAPAAVPDWLTVENHFATGGGDMSELKRIASPSVFSCPDCGGILFGVSQARPARFRCHTGHSYTLLSLLTQQEATIEESLWITVRALQEKERLAEQLASEFTGRSLVPDPGYAAVARRARSDAAQLRELLSLPRPTTAGPA
jgi:two-component system chemotaxis response regulator CheB